MNDSVNHSTKDQLFKQYISLNDSMTADSLTHIDSFINTMSEPKSHTLDIGASLNK